MVIPVIPLLVSAGVAVYAWFQRPNKNANTVFGFMVVTSVYLTLYWLQLVSVELATARFWMFAALPWELLMRAGWLVLALHVAGYKHRMRGVHYQLLAIIPIVVTLLGWTNPFHGLYGRDLHMEARGFFI